MRRVLLVLILVLAAKGLRAEDKKPPTTLRGVLLEQLRTTHDAEDWFVPASIAVQGLTAEQAKWSPGKGSHSVGQLAYHLWFWNSRELADFKGKKAPAFDGNNDQTFDNFTAAQWDDLVKKLNQVLTDWDTAVATADDQAIAKNARFTGCRAGSEAVQIKNTYHFLAIIS